MVVAVLNNDTKNRTSAHEQKKNDFIQIGNILMQLTLTCFVHFLRLGQQMKYFKLLFDSLYDT